MLENFTDRAKGVLDLANQQARRRKHPQTLPGHMLLAILAEGQNMAVAVLQKFRVDIKTFRDEVDREMGEMPAGEPPAKPVASPGLQQILQQARERAEAWGHGYPSTAHLLLALLTSDDQLVRERVAARGINLDDLEEEVARLLGTGEEEVTRDIGQLLANLLTQCGIADGRWFSPLLETLEDVSLDEALWKPVPDMLNTWQHILHVQFWCEYASGAVRGRPLPEAKDQWPEPPSETDPADWEQARHSLAQTLSSLREDLLWLKDRAAVQESGEPMLGSRALLAAGAIAHLAYHTGQIRLLLGMRSWTEHHRPKQWTSRTTTAK